MSDAPRLDWGLLAGHDRAKQNFPAIFALAVAGYGAREPLRATTDAGQGIIGETS